MNKDPLWEIADPATDPHRRDQILERSWAVIEQVKDAIQRSPFDEIVRIIQDNPTDSAIAFCHLVSSQHGFHTFINEKVQTSAEQGYRASQKSEPWQRLARSRYKELCEQSKRPPSFAECARDWHGEEFKDETGRPRRFPRNEQYLAKELSKLLNKDD